MTTATAPPPAAVLKHSARGHIRGSSLLLVGRFLAKGLNFLVQVLIVRYLSRSDYGSLAYALSIVAFVQALATFGLDRAITRFVPMYHERGEYGKLFGTVLMVLGTITSIGLGATLLMVAFQGLFTQSLQLDQQTLSLLLVLIFLAPIQSIDEVLVGLFAVFAKPRAIFFRKHVLAPLLKLLVVAALIATGGNVLFVAAGYFLAGLVGTSICMAVLWQVLRKQHLFDHFHARELEMPWKEVLFFTVPLLSSELVHVVMTTMDVIVLQLYGSTNEVAALRAVQPLALMNQLVMASFATLFIPMASRLFARGDRKGINDLYWQGTVWIAVMSFPIFLLTFSIAEPVTVLLYGDRYASSASILAVLSLAYYFNAATGLNGLTLKVCGELKYIVAMNVGAAALNLILILILIPRYGALGAAVGTSITIIVQTLLKQYGLRRTGVKPFDRLHAPVYGLIAVSAVGLFLAQHWLGFPAPLSLGLAAMACIAVLAISWRSLEASEMFPELRRLKLLRWWAPADA